MGRWARANVDLIRILSIQFCAGHFHFIQCRRQYDRHNGHQYKYCWWEDRSATQSEYTSLEILHRMRIDNTATIMALCHMPCMHFEAWSSLCIHRLVKVYSNIDFWTKWDLNCDFLSSLLYQNCFVTGCCVGHYNQRYFISLLFYMFVGCTYASIMNSIFVWIVHGDEFRTSLTLLKMVFPLAMLMYETSIYQYYLLMYMLLIIGSVFTGFLLIYHLRNMWRGCLTHEPLRQFDMGPMENIRMVFGERWYIAWLSPIVRSDLPFDGVDWQKVYEKVTKNL